MDALTRRFIRQIQIPLAFAGLIILIHLLQVTTGLSFTRLGVFPRRIEGLPGILTSPLIHGSWEHLFANTVSFLILGAVIFSFYPRIALRSLVWLYLMSGLGVWIVAEPNSFHIGASGVVYGMVSLVFWSGIFRRNLKSVVLGLIVLVLYSGFFAGIVPGKEGVSWESHLLGAIAGIVLAFIYRHDVEDDEIEEEPEPEEPEEKEYFLPRDTFEVKMRDRLP